MTRRKGLTVSKARRAMYTGGKYLGDYQAISRAVQTHSIAPVGKRIERRLIWRFGTQILRALSK